MCDFTLTYKGRVANSDSARHFYALHRAKQNKIIKHFAPKIFNVIKSQYYAVIREIRERGHRHARVIIDDLIRVDPMAKVLKDLYLRSAYIESNYVLNYLRPKKS